MINLSWGSGFKRAYKQRIRTDDLLKEKFWDSLDMFAHNPFNPNLKTHKLTGKLYGFWAFSVAYDCRVVFRFFDENKSVLLIDIGSHDEVY